MAARVLEHRGDHPGLVHIISAMEACNAYQPWHDKQTHKTFIRPDSGKCLHHYFYFMDARFVFRTAQKGVEPLPTCAGG